MTGNNITAVVTLNGEQIEVSVPPVVGVEVTPNPIPYHQETSDWNSVVDPTQILNKPSLYLENVVVKDVDYTMLPNSQVMVFTSSSNLTMLPATGTGHSVRIISRNCTVTIIPSGTDVVRENQISGYSDILLTDTQIGFWE